MSDIAIRVENLSKLYRIGTAGRPRYETLYDKIAGAGGRLLDRLRRPLVTHSAIHIPQSEIGNPQSDYIWALKDVSFEVKRGEVVGIIGRNGAGKSTLLKILSRITEPTEGRAYVYGRVGSLLEVGTGFHPELTGRENIYLNGAILGMRKAEIDRKFDEIVAFAEIEKFIDTPVKFYSSGMYVRLAFAVAAHLDPEILLVDEVLAVGDAAFQKKCLGKMGEVAGEGRTVLFVSHNMSSIRRMCEQVVWIHEGHLHALGETTRIVSAYESFMARQQVSDDSYSHRGTQAYFVQWRLEESDRSEPNVLRTFGPIRVHFIAQVERTVTIRLHSLVLFDTDSRLIWANGIKEPVTLNPGRYDFVYQFPGLPLRPGAYSWVVSLYDDERMLDEWHATPQLIVATLPIDNLSEKWVGILNFPYSFEVVPCR